MELPDDLVGRLEGKSSLGRLGLLIHSTAGFVDSGFAGRLTLELSNVANLPITIYQGMPIGQLSFMRMDGPVEHPYGSRDKGSKYQGQAEPTPSRFYLNFEDYVGAPRYHGLSMWTPGPLEIIIVLVVVLVIFGPKRLPDLGRSLGTGMREFKDSITGKDKEREELEAVKATAEKPEPAPTTAGERQS